MNASFKARGIFSVKWRPKNSYFKIGLTAFLVVAACMLFYFLIFRADTVGAGLSAFFNVINPILYGFIIAFILNPFFQLIENIFIKIVSRTKWHPKKAGRTAIRVICALLSAALCIFIIYALISQLIPELVKSIRNIVNHYNDYVKNIQNWIEATFSGNSLDSQTNEIFTTITTKINKWMQDTLTPQMDGFMDKITSSLMSVLVFFKNAFLGFIISIYILIEKDYIKARFKRLIYAVFAIHTGNRIIRNLRFVDEKFGGFLIGKMIDSSILGLICYFCMLILKMPYALLISVFVGVTNIIPFFGPFIGAIPSFILLFVVNPWYALYFAIMILVLQQLDGNLLAPKILGDSVGVSSFLVLISIVIGGGLFGVLGMVIAVPACAIIVAVIQSFVIKQDDKKQIPGELARYTNLGRINPATRNIEEKKPMTEAMGIYDRIKYRSETVRSYDYPVDERPWDWTKEKVDEYESVRETDEREEEESGEKIKKERDKIKRQKAKEEEERRKAAEAEEDRADEEENKTAEDSGSPDAADSADDKGSDDFREV